MSEKDGKWEGESKVRGRREFVSLEQLVAKSILLDGGPTMTCDQVS